MLGELGLRLLLRASSAFWDVRDATRLCFLLRREVILSMPVVKRDTLGGTSF